MCLDATHRNEVYFDLFLEWLPGHVRPACGDLIMIFHSLKFRFIALSLALVAIGVALRFGVALPYAQTQIQQLVSTQQMSLANIVAKDIAQGLQIRRRFIEKLSLTIPSSATQSQDAFKHWIDAQQNSAEPAPNHIMVIDPAGHVLVHNRPPPFEKVRVDIGNTQWFQEALKTTSPSTLSEPHYGLFPGDPTIIIAAPVRDADANVVAVIAAEYSLNGPGLLSILREYLIGDDFGGISLYSAGNTMLIGSTDPLLLLSPTPPTGQNLLLDDALAGWHGTGLTVGRHGAQELIATAAVPGTDWFAMVYMPADKVFAVVTSMRDMAIKGSLFSLLGVFIILYLVLPRMLRTVIQTAQALRDVADGKRELQPLPIHRNDEIGNLITGYNHLVTRLREKEAALKETEARLSFLAHHDSLTGLYNRAMFEQRLQQALDRAARHNTQFALLFCDLDGFKSINDTHGHAVGDIVLARVAARFQRGRKHTDTVARLGGDEFVLLLTELNDARKEATAVARRCIADISKPYGVDGKTFQLSVSIGIVLYRDASDASSQLISQADVAMYRAKHTAKGGFCFFEDLEATGEPAPYSQEIPPAFTKPKAKAVQGG